MCECFILNITSKMSTGTLFDGVVFALAVLVGNVFGLRVQHSSQTDLETSYCKQTSGIGPNRTGFRYRQCSTHHNGVSGASIDAGCGAGHPFVNRTITPV